jgi:uncharacterized protein
MTSEEQAPSAEDLIDNTSQGRFELYRDGELVGWLYYTHLKPNRYTLQHTEVEPSHRHQGVAGAMVRRLLTRSAPARTRPPESAPRWSTTSRERPPVPI